MTRRNHLAVDILIVGDVHGQWTDADRRFVESGDQEIVLFVGDLGDEDVGVVRAIAELDVPKAVLLGNHDAWQSFSRRRASARLRESLERLGDDHLGYGRRELPGAGVTLVGARPFSWGGDDLRSIELYEELYGVASMRESALRIAGAASAAEHDDLLILAHNGPAGLSSQPADICGKDFGRNPGGDWGDRDLQLAIEGLRTAGPTLRAVVAGHMHDRLASPRGAMRTRFVEADAVAYVNAAVVPRLRCEPGAPSLRHYVRTGWDAGRLIDVEEIWVDDDGLVRERTVPRFERLSSVSR